MKTPTEKEQNQIAMWGMTLETLEREIKAHLRDVDNPTFYAVCVMSDAQEEMVRGNTETARQFINKAKYALIKYQK